jgi:hypothetical protein
VLEILGLTAVEEAVYEALVHAPELTAEAVADAVTVADVGPTLQRLEVLELIRATEQGYVAEPPDIVLQRLLARQRTGLDDAAARVRQLDQLYRDHRVDHRDSPVEVVPGADAVGRIYAMHRTGRQLVRAFETPPYAGPPAGQEYGDLGADGISRGVYYRIVYSREAVAEQGFPELLAGVAAGGEEARVVRDVPLRLTIFDDTAAVLPVHTGSLLTNGVLVVRAGALLDALIALFESVWAHAVPLEPTGPLPAAVDAESDAADAVDDVLVALLTAGMSDHAIARALGISVRTVGRRVQQVLTTLNATTRFQAGIALGMTHRPNGSSAAPEARDIV